MVAVICEEIMRWFVGAGGIFSGGGEAIVDFYICGGQKHNSRGQPQWKLILVI